MKDMSFTFHEDAGHGWLEVEESTARNVGLLPTDFSECSYRKGNVLFLEEDCDGPKFAQAWKSAGKHFAVRTEYHNNECFIRNLNHIR